MQCRHWTARLFECILFRKVRTYGTEGKETMSKIRFHKDILEWQAAHPNVTWVFWGIVWAVVLALLLWPGPVE